MGLQTSVVGLGTGVSVHGITKQSEKKEVRESRVRERGAVFGRRRQDGGHEAENKHITEGKRRQEDEHTAQLF